MIYYISMSTLMFFGYFVKNRRSYYIFLIVILFAFTAFRNINLGGSDAISYQAFFRDTPVLGDFFQNLGSYRYENGFAFVNSLSKSISNNYLVYQILYTFISTILLVRLISHLDMTYKEKCLFLFTYFCFRYFLNSFVLLRQNIANLIIWNLIVDNWDGIKKTAISIYISTLFHVTSMFNFIVWPLLLKLQKINKKYIFIGTIILSLFLLFAGSNIINTGINYFVRLVGPKYSKYIIENGETVRGFNFIYYIIRFVIITLFYIFYDKINYDKKDILFYCGCVAIVVGSIDVEIFTRMMEYYMIAFYIMCTVIFRAFTREEKSILIFIFFILMMIILIRSLYTTSGGLFLDYSFLIRKFI